MLISGATTSFQQISEIRRKLGIGPLAAGVPIGGATNTILTKLSPADYNTGWAALLGGLITAGNGITFAGNTVHFAQAAAYTAGAIPFATGAATMGFDAANLFWDATNMRLGVGTNIPTDRLTVTRAYADANNRSMANFTATTSVSGGTKRIFLATLKTTGAANFGPPCLLSGALIGCLHEGTGTVITGGFPMVGLELYHGKGPAGTGAVSTSIGLYVQSLNQNATGAITTTYDIYIPAPIATGVITNRRAIYIADSGATEPAADGNDTRLGVVQVGLWDANFFGGNISVGTAAYHRNDIIHCEKTFSSTLHSTGVAAILTLNPTGAHTEWNAAGYFILTTTGVQNFTYGVDSLIGVLGQATHNGTGTCAGVMGGRFYAVKSNTGVVTVLTGAQFGIYNSNAVGAVTSGYGFYVQTPSVVGTITTNYQAYLAAGAGATSYGLYQAGVSDFNFFNGYVAIGNNTNSTNATLRVDRNYALSASNVYGTYCILTNTAGAANAMFNIGGFFSIVTAGGFDYSNAESLTGLGGQATHNGSGTATTLTGVRGNTTKGSTGPVTSAYGFRALIFNSNATGAIGTGYAYYAHTPIVTGAITTYYGLYLSAGAGTTKYGIAQVGANDLNYFAGFTAFGSAAPVNTTFALFGAGTTAASSLRVVPGVAPTAPVSGDIWSDGVNLFWRSAAGVSKQLDN